MKCLLCDTNTIGDEFHYILQCRYFEQSRKSQVTLEIDQMFLNLKIL